MNFETNCKTFLTYVNVSQIPAFVQLIKCLDSIVYISKAILLVSIFFINQKKEKIAI